MTLRARGAGRVRSNELGNRIKHDRTLRLYDHERGYNVRAGCVADLSWSSFRAYGQETMGRLSYAIMALGFYA